MAKSQTGSGLTERNVALLRPIAVLCGPCGLERRGGQTPPLRELAEIVGNLALIDPRHQPLMTSAISAEYFSFPHRPKKSPESDYVDGPHGPDLGWPTNAYLPQRQLLGRLFGAKRSLCSHL